MNTVNSDKCRRQSSWLVAMRSCLTGIGYFGQVSLPTRSCAGNSWAPTNMMLLCQSWSYSMKASVQHAAMPSITDFHTTNTHLDGFDGLAPAKRTNKQLQTERSAKKEFSPVLISLQLTLFGNRRNIWEWQCAHLTVSLLPAPADSSAQTLGSSACPQKIKHGRGKQLFYLPMEKWFDINGGFLK